MNSIRTELRAWVQWVVVYWPESPSGELLRRWYWSRLTNVPVRMLRGAVLDDPQSICFGIMVSIAGGVGISAGGGHGIYIGSGVAIGPGVYMRAADHIADGGPVLENGMKAAAIPVELSRSGRVVTGREYSIVIRENVWIGAHSIILNGADIGESAVIGAGTVVRGRVPAHSVFVGNPGRVYVVK